MRRIFQLFLALLAALAVWAFFTSFLLFLGFGALLLLWGIAVESWVWKWGTVGRIAAFVPLAGVAFLLYTDQHPLDSFYRERFTSVTGHPFPSGGKLLYKEFYSAGNGDTFLCAVFEVPQGTYIQLRDGIPPATSKLPPKGCADKFLEQRGGSNIAAETSYDRAPDANYYWGLVHGRNEVVVSYSLW